MLILGQTVTPEVSMPFLDVLTNYGILGMFAGLMIFIIRYLSKKYESQNDKLIDTYTKQHDAIKNEKDNLNMKFIAHLESTEKQLLEIISDNTIAFKLLVESNNTISTSINNLTNAIHTKHN